MFNPEYRAAVREGRYWFNRYRELPRWRFLARRQAAREMRRWLLAALKAKAKEHD